MMRYSTKRTECGWLTERRVPSEIRMLNWLSMPCCGQSRRARFPDAWRSSRPRRESGVARLRRGSLLTTLAPCCSGRRRAAFLLRFRRTAGPGRRTVLSVVSAARRVRRGKSCRGSAGRQTSSVGPSSPPPRDRTPCPAIDLIETLWRALADNTVGKTIERICRNNLIIIDEMGCGWEQPCQCRGRVGTTTC